MLGADYFEALEGRMQAREAAGDVDGRHYSQHVADVKALLRAGDDDAAAGVLLRLIDAIEREAKIPAPGVCGVPPWFFKALGAIYKRKGMKEQAALLAQRHNILQANAEREGALALEEMRRRTRP